MKGQGLDDLPFFHTEKTTATGKQTRLGLRTWAAEFAQNSLMAF